MKLYEKIRELRKKRGWSQAELGNRLGIHGGHVSRLENGKYQPSIDILKKLSEVFEVSADYFLSESEEFEEVHIQDQALSERIELLNSLDGKDKETIIHMIDTILTKRKMVELLSKELNLQH